MGAMSVSDVFPFIRVAVLACPTSPVSRPLLCAATPTCYPHLTAHPV